MDSATEDLYFQKLQEFVQDEDKIVTVASFAADRGISIQNSRKLITKYAEDQRKLKSDELAVTYVLTGVLKDTGARGVFMVKEEDLERKQELFENELYKLIYSIQKCRHINFNIIALVDMLDATKIREKALEGSVVSKNCVKRILKVKKSTPPPPPTVKGKSSFFEPKPGTSIGPVKSPEKKRQEPSKNDHKTNGSASITGMFKAAAAKSNQQNSQRDSSSNGVAAKSKSGMDSGIKSEKLSAASSDLKDNVRDDEIVEIMDDEVTDTRKEEKVSSKPDKKKRRRDKSQDVPSKRRKRIVERNDSDSDDMFERDDNEDIVERSDDEPDRIPSPVNEKKLPPKNKRRKAVEKTYTDEEGFVGKELFYSQ
ncbi:hypothetical protein NQ318_006110 [Aromia moschata]|uniref:DNA polymerase delta subunit 3 n=1 Tax=Aromia moschata TaxID=1265417 RepID=A0AAV8Z2R6_9CUCU|nr:hypothetical protein NQ318_006110 [Aromia moschata]